MKCQKVNIATARIEGLKKAPYYLKHHCYFAWDIMFSDTSTKGFHNLPQIQVGDTEEEGKLLCEQYKDNFKQANIHDGDKVVVLYGANGRVRAIGCIGQDSWIDVEDNFVKKTFIELNIIIISLKVH